MNIRLKPISPKRISDQVFDQLRELIFRGDFQPGQKIMTERELATALNVSRNSVREAINKLVRTSRCLIQEYGREPTSDEIAKKMEFPVSKVRKILKIAQEPISLETPIGEEEEPSAIR